MTRLHKAVNACIMQPVGRPVSLGLGVFTSDLRQPSLAQDVVSKADSEYMNYHNCKRRNGGGEGGYGMHGNLSGVCEIRVKINYLPMSVSAL